MGTKMVDEPVYPIVALGKDSDEFFDFQSFVVLQGELEIIDVENGEYEAWDSLGRRVMLQAKPEPQQGGLLPWLISLLSRRRRETEQSTTDEDWLLVTVASPEPDLSLRPTLRSFLAARGRIANDHDSLASLISQLPTISGR